MALNTLRAGRSTPTDPPGTCPCVGLVLLQVATAAVLLIASSGCGGAEEPRLVQVSEARPYVGNEPEIGVGSAERFGFGPPSVAPDEGVVPEGAFAYDLPEGWATLAPTSMRAVNLTVESDPRAECTLVLLGGSAGGLAANVNRWRGQMGLGPLAPADLEALPEDELLGAPAVRIDFAGDYTGMGGGGGAGFRMVGLLAVAPGGSAFLKFTGPAPIVAAELAAFDRLARSLRPADSAAPTDAAEPVASSSDSDEEQAILRWTAPDSWTEGPARMLRDVTYTTDPAGTVECYISILAGDGGGIRSNLDRWRGQMGAAPLTSTELAELERIDCLGSTAVLIEIAGDFEGMGGQRIADALMLGAVASLDGRTVFVKLVGPATGADAERERFLQFVQSLERAQ